MNHRNDGVPAQHWLLKSLFVVVAAAAAAIVFSIWLL